MARSFTHRWKVSDTALREESKSRTHGHDIALFIQEQGRVRLHTHVCKCTGGVCVHTASGRGVGTKREVESKGKQPSSSRHAKPPKSPVHDRMKTQKYLDSHLK